MLGRIHVDNAWKQLPVSIYIYGNPLDSIYDFARFDIDENYVAVLAHNLNYESLGCCETELCLSFDIYLYDSFRASLPNRCYASSLNVLSH